MWQQNITTYPQTRPVLLPVSDDIPACVRPCSLIPSHVVLNSSNKSLMHQIERSSRLQAERRPPKLHLLPTPTVPSIIYQSNSENSSLIHLLFRQPSELFLTHLISSEPAENCFHFLILFFFFFPQSNIQLNMLDRSKIRFLSRRRKIFPDQRVPPSNVCQ